MRKTLFISLILLTLFSCRKDLSKHANYIELKTYYDKENLLLKEHRILYTLGPINTGTSTVYREDGSKQGEGIVKGSLDSVVQHGTWKFYHDSEELLSEGDFFENKKQGYWVQYFKDGKKASEGYYDKGLNTGAWKYYYESGVLQQEINMVEGVASGIVKDYYPNGQLKSKGSLQQNVPNGFFTEFWETGLPKNQRSYVRGQLIGKFKDFYKNGKIFLEGDWDIDKPRGKMFEYDSLGNHIKTHYLDKKDNLITEKY